MATAFEKEVIEANKKYASEYKHGGLDTAPKKKAVISQFRFFSNHRKKNVPR